MTTHPTSGRRLAGPVDSPDGAKLSSFSHIDVIFTVEGWEDYDGNRHDGPADDITDTYGTFVHVTNPDDPAEHHYFWAFVGGPFEDWDEWYVYIGALMEMYGMGLE